MNSDFLFGGTSEEQIEHLFKVLIIAFPISQSYFARKQYQNDEEKNEFFNSFIYRVVLFDDCVYIFYNTLPNTPTKVKLDKSELTELREYRENRKSTHFQPLGFKLGANGGGGGIRTPVTLPPNGFQDRLVVTASIRLRGYIVIFGCGHGRIIFPLRPWFYYSDVSAFCKAILRCARIYARLRRSRGFRTLRAGTRRARL